MAGTDDTIENPVTGQRLTFLVTGTDSGGEFSRSEGVFPAGGFAGVEHVHPRQDEHFEVLAGDAAFTIEGADRVLGAGQSVDVPAGTRHTFRNAGDDEMRVVAEFRPATESTERFYELYFGFAQEGRVNSKALPDLLDIALIWPLVSDHAMLAKPPAWVQNVLFRALLPIARARRRQLPSCKVIPRAS